MAEAKPFASLSSGLLARKGAAKPAMRPQGFGSFGGSLEDLGWNDMGHAGPEHVPSSVEALTPAPRLHAAPEPEPGFEPVEPPVFEQHRAIEEAFEEAEEAFEPEAEEVCEPEVDAAYEPEVEAVCEPEAVAEPEPLAVEPEPEPEPEPVRAAPAPVVPISNRRVAAAPKGKAAFTLRLDPERHLKLRLACAVTRRSAQQLVTGALDDFLSSLPEVQALAERVPAEAGRRAR
ncbi:MAG: hypothetical protein JO013_10575 [Alphaproteobacteria bacterium]|nr:hypothetical protein [Alphaproteobacteria bacterium]